MFHTVVHWHKLGEVENECTLHNFGISVINVPKIIKVSKSVADVLPPRPMQSTFNVS